MKSILDPKFKYVPSVETDLRKTFKRIRAEDRRARAQTAKIVRSLPIKLTKGE